MADGDLKVHFRNRDKGTTKFIHLANILRCAKIPSGRAEVVALLCCVKEENLKVIKICRSE